MSLWCFIACFSLTCCLVSGQNAKYVLVGEHVDFPGFSDTKEFPADILWKHIEGHKVQKVVHFNSKQEAVFGSFLGRVTLGWHSADLSIKELRCEDSGFYDLEILINNQYMTKRYELRVIDKVTKPTISCEINNASTSESAGKATLLCSLPSHSDQSSLKFQWSTNAKIHLGHVLKISLGGEFDDHQYNCTVNNPLTQESAVFIAKKCYSETKAQAGLIAGVVVAVVTLLLILLILFVCRKKVCSNNDKSDLETQSNPQFPKATSGSEEIQGLLNRQPTLPSKQTLGHLNQQNDTLSHPSQKEQIRISRKSHHRNQDEAHMNELKESIHRHSSLVKQLHKNENGKADEAESREGEEEKVLENDPSDSETMNPDQTALSSESSPEKNTDEDNKASHPPLVPQKSNLVKRFSALQKANENTNPKVIKKQGLDDPADSGNPNDVSNDQSPEKNTDEDNKASHPPLVPQKSNLVKTFSALQKVNENTSPKVIKKQGLDDPADSGNPNDVSNDQMTENTDPEDKRPVSNDPSDSGNPNEVPENQNSESKKEENEFAKSAPENDVQPPPVAKENSPSSQNSPESSPKAEHKQDINSDEDAMISNGESSSSLEELENEEQVPPASTPKKTVSETKVEEQKPALSETESEM